MNQASQLSDFSPTVKMKKTGIVKRDKEKASSFCFWLETKTGSADEAGARWFPEPVSSDLTWPHLVRLSHTREEDAGEGTGIGSELSCWWGAQASAGRR